MIHVCVKTYCEKFLVLQPKGLMKKSVKILKTEKRVNNFLRIPVSIMQILPVKCNTCHGAEPFWRRGLILGESMNINTRGFTPNSRTCTNSRLWLSIQATVLVVIIFESNCFHRCRSTTWFSCYIHKYTCKPFNMIREMGGVRLNFPRIYVCMVNYNDYKKE